MKYPLCDAELSRSLGPCDLFEHHHALWKSVSTVLTVQPLRESYDSHAQTF